MHQALTLGGVDGLFSQREKTLGCAKRSENRAKLNPVVDIRRLELEHRLEVGNGGARAPKPGVGFGTTKQDRRIGGTRSDHPVEIPERRMVLAIRAVDQAVAEVSIGRAIK